MGSVAASVLALTSPQRQMADIIEKEFLDAGYSPAVVAAALVNALAESGLNPRAAGDSGWSIGLFQMNRKAGAGKGHSVAELEDPTQNVRILLSVEKKALAKVEAAVKAGAGIAEAAGLFAVYVERPRDTVGEKARRAAAVARYFPKAAIEALEGGAKTAVTVWAASSLLGILGLGLFLAAKKWKTQRRIGERLPG